MNEKLSTLINTLKENKIEHRVIKLPGPAIRTRDVIEHVDVNPDHIVKTIVFKKKKTGEAFAVAVPSKYRVSYKKIRSLVDDQVSPLSPDELRVLGWEPGECCPLSINCFLYVDPEVFAIDTVNTGSGDLYYGLEFPSKAINTLRSDFEVAEVREELQE